MCDRERTTEFESIGVANGWNPNYLAVYDEVELNGGQTTISMTIYFNIKDDPKHNAYDQQEMEFVQQPAEYDVFEDMDVEEPEVEVVEDDYQEEEQLDALLEDTVVPEELEDDFDPMRA